MCVGLWFCLLWGGCFCFKKYFRLSLLTVLMPSYLKIRVVQESRRGKSIDFLQVSPLPQLGPGFNLKWVLRFFSYPRRFFSSFKKVIEFPFRSIDSSFKFIFAEGRREQNYFDFSGNQTISRPKKVYGYQSSVSFSPIFHREISMECIFLWKNNLILGQASFAVPVIDPRGSSFVSLHCWNPWSAQTCTLTYFRWSAQSALTHSISSTQYSKKINVFQHNWTGVE